MDIDATVDPDRVVVGVDGTWNALGAVTWAATEARLRGVALHVLHAAASATTGTTRIQDVLDRAFATARLAQPDLPVTTAHADNTPVAALLVAAEHAGLLVVGMADRDRTEELLLGLVALDVSGRASCPVAVVRGERRLPGGDGPVLVGVDTAEVDGPGLTVAFDDARRHSSGLVVLHVRRRPGHVRVHGSEEDRSAHVAAWNTLTDSMDPWSQRYPDVPVDVQVVRGNATRTLLAAAATVRLVVLGSRGRSAPARALFGSTSREVLRLCPVPVVVVSPGAGDRHESPVAMAAGPAAPIGQASARTERDHPHDHDRLW
jgi:nucleotide-binding universal stress UspA family protein